MLHFPWLSVEAALPVKQDMRRLNMLRFMHEVWYSQCAAKHQWLPSFEDNCPEALCLECQQLCQQNLPVVQTQLQCRAPEWYKGTQHKV